MKRSVNTRQCKNSQFNGKLSHATRYVSWQIKNQSKFEIAPRNNKKSITANLICFKEVKGTVSYPP